MSDPQEIDGSAYTSSADPTLSAWGTCFTFSGWTYRNWLTGEELHGPIRDGVVIGGPCDGMRVGPPDPPRPPSPFGANFSTAVTVSTWKAEV